MALKQIKFDDEMTKEGFPVTALREISVLLSLSHENVVSVREMCVGSSFDKVFMVMEVSVYLICNDTFIFWLFLTAAYSLYLLLQSVYGNGLERCTDKDGTFAVSSIGAQKHATPDSIRYKSYSPKVAVAS